MRKNYVFPFIFLLLLNISMFGQKVTLTPTVVNGAGFSAGPINLASIPYSTISLGVKVEVPSNVAVGDQGTIKIYFSKGLALGGNVAIGGDGGALYFGGGKVATRNFVINLNWTDFLTAGGFIYAEYKSGVSYNSSNVAVVKNATMTIGTTLNPPADAPNPKQISNTLCCNQTIRQGDKPAPITGSQYLNPYQGEPYGINSQWTNTRNGESPKLDDINRILYFDYAPELKNITVTRKLGYRYGGEFPNQSNTVTITVVPTPILTNSISTNSVPNSDGYYELSSVKTLNLYGFASKVNLNILQDPTHKNQRGDNITDVDGYKWEYKNTELYSNPWITIPNETYGDLNFSDPSQLSNFEDTYYLVRRIAIYKNISRVSNEIKIAVRGLRFNNTICCDQILKIQSPTSFENPTIIRGSIASVDTPIEQGINFKIRSINYQWQSQSTTGAYPTSTWSNIPGATSKDYLPSQPLKVETDRRRGYKFESSYKYRRIVNIDYSIVKNILIYGTATSYSNEISLDGTASLPYIQIYPNPASSILNIECTLNISDAKLTISNILGNIVNSNNFSVLNPKLININVSDFPAGAYFITIENQYLGIVQKTFIKQ